jgi:hypothetical protein
LADLLQQEVEGDEQAAEDHRHLLLVCYPHGLCTAGRGVEDHQSPDEDTSPAEWPAQHGAEHDARCVDREAGTQSALDQKEDGGEQARAFVETFADELVSRIHVPLVIERDEDPRDHHHGQRKPEVELNEAHALQEPLAGGAQEGDGAGLRGHHAERHGPPAVFIITT